MATKDSAKPQSSPPGSAVFPDIPKSVWDEYDAMLPSDEEIIQESKNRPFGEITSMGLDVPEEIDIWLQNGAHTLPQDDQI